jgi:hypothetical protein
MIPSFKNFYELKSNIVKPTKTSKKHTQSWNRGTDRKHLNFVPRSDNKKRAHFIVKRFEQNPKLKQIVLPNDNGQTAKDLANIFGLTISDDEKNFNKSLKRSGLNLIKMGSKYIVIRKK